MEDGGYLQHLKLDSANRLEICDKMFDKIQQDVQMGSFPSFPVQVFGHVCLE
jgi:hypothetical protein